MNNHLKQFFSQGRRAKLAPGERRYLRQQLLSFMSEHPLVEGAAPKLPKSPNAAWTFFVTPKLQPLKLVALILALVLTSGGGIALAAESSLPGDILYPVKISLTEKVRGSLTPPGEKKAAWEVRLAEKRLDEATKLASSGRLNAVTQTQLNNNFTTHANNAKKEIEHLQATGQVTTAARISSSFESSLKAQQKILSHLTVKKSDDGQDHPTTSLLNSLNSQSDSNTETRKRLEAEVATSSASTNLRQAAENKGREAQHKIDEVRTFIEGSNRKLTATSTTEARLRLATAVVTQATGQTQLQTGAYGQAFSTFQQAQRIAQEAKLLVKAQIDLKVDISDDLDKDEKSEQDDKKILLNKQSNSSENSTRQRDQESRNENEIDD